MLLLHCPFYFLFLSLSLLSHSLILSLYCMSIDLILSPFIFISLSLSRYVDERRAYKIRLTFENVYCRGKPNWCHKFTNICELTNKNSFIPAVSLSLWFGLIWYVYVLLLICWSSYIQLLYIRSPFLSLYSWIAMLWIYIYSMYTHLYMLSPLPYLFTPTPPHRYIRAAGGRGISVDLQTRIVSSFPEFKKNITHDF